MYLGAADQKPLDSDVKTQGCVRNASCRGRRALMLAGLEAIRIRQAACFPVGYLEGTGLKGLVLKLQCKAA